MPILLESADKMVDIGGSADGMVDTYLTVQSSWNSWQC